MCGPGFVDVTKPGRVDRQGSTICNDLKGSCSASRRMKGKEIFDRQEYFVKDNYVEFQTARRRESSFGLVTKRSRSLSFRVANSQYPKVSYASWVREDIVSPSQSLKHTRASLSSPESLRRRESHQCRSRAFYRIREVMLSKRRMSRNAKRLEKDSRARLCSKSNDNDGQILPVLL